MSGNILKLFDIRRSVVRCLSSTATGGIITRNGVLRNKTGNIYNSNVRRLGPSTINLSNWVSSSENANKTLAKLNMGCWNWNANITCSYSTKSETESVNQEDANDYHNIIKNEEKATGQTEKLEFQAETRMLLDIVAKSLYSESESIDENMDDLNSLPYRAEYAKSGRASCKGCKTTIDKGVLRLAILTTSRFHDGKDCNWHHVDCFFAKSKPKSTGDFGHFESLRWDDQEMIKKRIANSGTATVSKGATAIAKETKKDYKVEYAKSKASKCVACEEHIEKQAVRIGKMDYTSERAVLYAPFFRWHHVDCFIKIRNEIEIGFYDSGSNIPGFVDLDEEDKAMIKSKIPAIPKGKRKLPDDQEASGSKPSKQSKTETSQNGKADKLDSIDEKVKSQNKQLYKWRDILEKNLKPKELSRILSHNKQDVPTGEGKMLDRLSDIMTFGTLLPCKTCKNGQFVYRSGLGYQCMGNITEFTSCGEVTEDPKRTKFKLPQDFQDTPGLENYKSKVEKRVIPKRDAPVQAKDIAAKKTGALNSVPKINSKPLKGFKIAIDDAFSKKEKEKMTSKIESFGGAITSRLTDKTAFYVSTKEAVNEVSKNIKKAKERGLPVVSTEFVDTLTEVKYNLAEAVKRYLISDWIDDIRGRLLTLNGEFEKPWEKKEGRNILEKEMTNQKLKMKGGAVVDPDSELEHKGHILKMANKKGYYNAVLNRVNIEEDKNSFYKLQIIESDKQPHKYWLFRGWGRIGTTQGGTKVDEGLNKNEAIEMFEHHFSVQTENEWGATFVKKPGKYISVEIDYSESDKINKIVPSTSKSSLPLSVQELICLIFDIDKMKETMIEFEIDMDKMPLGKISRQQILKAYEALNGAMQLIDSKSSKERMLLDASNRFFSLIPHNFGVKSVPLLDDVDIIKSKIEMLDNLMEIELAYQLLREGESEDGSVDVNYKKLNASIDILENNSEDFKILQKYLENTHATTHDSYALEIDQIFKVDRKGEKKRYRPFKQLHNRKLLWHGSRTTNYVGILSQGLRIAPPEAPVTGYMFGKGIYFADMVSKSANYCFTSPSNNTGLLMLCEVALGDMHERTTAKESLSKPPDSKHSVKGCGSTEPNPAEIYKFSDGLEVPYGKPTKTKKSTSLLYNEYIVYDVAQVNIRYLLKVNFKYKGKR